MKLLNRKLNNAGVLGRPELRHHSGVNFSPRLKPSFLHPGELETRKEQMAKQSDYTTLFNALRGLLTNALRARQ
tara:strand:- start:326 stop:547 length:222 start_codon:yes stop_codon:yes gene_type:complete